ncbi:MAG: PD40 domain-containing protein [Burkholderiales bacterium]|nr:PD40 domain-containing protein [Burkholderiales bacterium]
MRSCIRVLAGLALSLSTLWPVVASAADADPARPLWLRQPAVSPDGSRISFAYGGQIWVVPAAGGEAVPLTSALFYSSKPVWSPDGQRIAFASSRNGNPDVFVMPADGGAITQLTHHSAPDLPQAFTPDGKEVLFTSPRLGSAKADALDSVRGLGPLLPQLYAVAAGGGRPRLVLPTSALDVQPSADGNRLLYTDLKAPENEFRKHHQSDATRDIWLVDQRSGVHRRLTDFRGEDRNPVWSPKEDATLWLSERSGSFNVWRQPLEGGTPQQLTFHKDNPVRFLTTARDGTLVYGYDGEIWRLPAGASQPARVPVRIRQGNLLAGEFIVNLNEQATELAVSPVAPEVALIARGDVFVVSLISGVTRRITHTAAQERNVSFSPDGRRLLYASERSGSWDVFEAKLRYSRDIGFAGVSPYDEAVLIGGPEDNFQPIYSPDGTRVAYRADRNTLRVFEIATKSSVEVLSRDAVYSYADGDLNFAWSPDGRWLATRTGFEIGNAEVELVDASGRTPRRNISRSGFLDMLPQFSADGSTILWLSDRVAVRTADASPAALDVIAAFLTPEAFDAFRATTEERVRLAKLQATQPSAMAKRAQAAADALANPSLDGLQRRTVRLTPFSVMPVFYRLMPDGHGLIVVAADPTSGMLVGYAIDLPSRRPRTLFQLPPSAVSMFETDAEVKTLYALGPGGIQRIDLASGQSVTVPFNAEVARDPQAEIAGIFEHTWRLTKVKFYDRGLHGRDWDTIGRTYRKFLPHLKHWEDLAEVLSEMSGELDASHQGSRFATSPVEGHATGALGLYYNHAHRGAGLEVAEVLPGGPADRPGSALRSGAVVLAIDSQAIGPDDDIDRLLDRKFGQSVLVTVRPAGGGNPVEEVLNPVHWLQESTLAYRRWVQRRRAEVTRLSGGRIGYLHLSHMALGSYLEAYSDLFGQHRHAEAVLVDVRHNGGGNLHDALIAMLTGASHASMVTRDGVRLGTIPAARWGKPSAVLANSGSYSDGSVFPALYQRERIGPLIGERVPGTGTAVIWEQQIEPRLKYGVPQLGFMGNDGRWFENQEVVPELPVYNDPASVAAGRDLQLERAVSHLLDKLGPAGAKK